MASSRSLIGERVGNYEILRELGRGGMGVVYKACNQTTNQAVALKLLPRELSKNPHAVSRFLREAEALSMVSHPNIVSVLDSGKHDSQYYIAMEYIKGVTVRRLIKRKGRLDVPRALGIVQHAAEGLADAHSLNIVHRDVKPQNIMIDRGHRICVVDFGLAIVGETAHVVMHGKQAGTPTYMSPEQCQGIELDTRTDIYSLGVTLYEMLVGCPPIEADTPAALMYKIVSEQFPEVTAANPLVPPLVNTLIQKMVAKDVHQRYDSIEHVSRDCAAILRGEHPAIEPPTEPIAIRDKAGRRLLDEELRVAVTERAAILYPQVSPFEQRVRRLKEATQGFLESSVLAPIANKYVVGVVVAVLVLVIIVPFAGLVGPYMIEWLESLRKPIDRLQEPRAFMRQLVGAAGLTFVLSLVVPIALVVFIFRRLFHDD